MSNKRGKAVAGKIETSMRQDHHVPNEDPNKKHHGRLPLKKRAANAKPATVHEQETFINISQEQKHGRGPRR